MSKKAVGQIKLQLPAGAANPAPPVGPLLVLRVLISWAFAKNLMPKLTINLG